MGVTVARQHPPIATEGENVIGPLSDVIAAEGFERDRYFRGVGKDADAPANLVGDGARRPSADLEVPAEQRVHPDRATPGAARAGRGRRRVQFRRGPARGWARSPSLTGDWPSSRSRTIQVARFRERAEGCATLLRTTALAAGHKWSRLPRARKAVHANCLCSAVVERAELTDSTLTCATPTSRPCPGIPRHRRPGCTARRPPPRALARRIR